MSLLLGGCPPVLLALAWPPACCCAPPPAASLPPAAVSVTTSSPSPTLPPSSQPRLPTTAPLPHPRPGPSASVILPVCPLALISHWHSSASLVIFPQPLLPTTPPLPPTPSPRHCSPSTAPLLPPPPSCRSYGLDLLLLSIDEGISGYRDDSLDTVKRNEAQYQIPLHVFSYKDLYGWTMDEIGGCRRAGDSEWDQG